MENTSVNYFEIQKCVLVKEQDVPYTKDFSVTGVYDTVSIGRSLGLADLAEEHLSVFCLNPKGRIIAFHNISHGTVNAAQFSPRDIFKRALLNNATSIIVIHNHPSGDPTPSKDDIIATERLVEAGKTIDIRVLDHIILTEDNFYSFKEEDIIN